MYGWGLSSHGLLGGVEDNHVQNKEITMPAGYGRVVGCCAGFKHSICWTDEGKILGSGLNKYGQLW